jgi:hypothetical protein
VFSNKNFLNIIAEKPDTFGNIPEIILPKEKAEELRQIPRLTIGEIYNAEGIEGQLYILSKKRPDAFLPTLTYTGAGYGSIKVIGEKLKAMKKIVEKKMRIYFIEPLIFGSPDFWRALNIRFSHEIKSRFGFISPCYGCRLYSFAVRVPLCKSLNVKTIIPEDIFTSNSNSKIFNSKEAVKYYRLLMSNFGIDLWYDNVSFEETRNTFKAEENTNTSRNKYCLFDENYFQMDGSFIPSNSLKDFFEKFALPAAAKIISKKLSGAKLDYDSEVKDTLLPVKKDEKRRRKTR